MSVVKFSIDFFEEEKDNWLVGMYCSLEAHRLAFLLNQELQTFFVRHREDFFDQETNARYALFSSEKAHTEKWYLVENQSLQERSYGGLFEEIQTYSFLVKEHKKANYLLKIDNPSNQFSKETLLSNLRKIPQIHFSYSIELNSLKSKYKLIF